MFARLFLRLYNNGRDTSFRFPGGIMKKNVEPVSHTYRLTETLYNQDG